MRTTQMLRTMKPVEGLDPIPLVVHLAAPYSLFPDLLEVFGEDIALRFLERFSGRSVTLPSIEDMERHLVDFTIWSELTENRGHNMPLLRKRLQERYSMTSAEIDKAFDRVQYLVSDIDPLGVIFTTGRKSSKRRR